MSVISVGLGCRMGTFVSANMAQEVCASKEIGGISTQHGNIALNLEIAL